ncbi:MAG: hypothetical protein GY815_02940 [Gammaproteobacteria bacterium]|nr:hypothetical protein [Gammaproteobacteria bacterium]
MPEYRKSALSLYQLEAKDRRWLLARLSDEHRGILEALLTELESLGFPRQGYDSALIETDEKSPDKAQAPRDLQLLEDASAEEIATMLRGESASVIAAALSLQRWRWQAEFMRQLVISEHRNIAMGIEAGRRNGISQALRAAMLASLARMLRRLRDKRFEASIEKNKVIVCKTPRGLLHRGLRMLWPA